MLIRKLCTSLSVVILASQSVFATTWGDAEVADPIMTGETCQVSEPASYGSYIYHSPSKYDQVFWPYTDQHGIWVCEASGFVGLIGDFTLSEQEKAAITHYLSAHTPDNTNIVRKLETLEALTAIRDLDGDERNHMKRLLARWYEDLGDPVKANKYRQAALSEIALFLANNAAGEVDEYHRLQYLYVATAYSYHLGKTDDGNTYKQAFEQLSLNLKDPDNLGFADYLKALLEDIRTIPPGGALSLPVDQ